MSADIGVLSLGPKWVKELKDHLEKKREATVSMASRCKPDGDYRKQMEMVVAELDLMLAAPEMFEALQEAYSIICTEVADGEHTELAHWIRKVVAKAIGVQL